MYAEEDFLTLSGLQHFAFCRRQWALNYVEQQWLENLRTIEGAFFHERAHSASSEKKGDIFITRGMTVFSAQLGVRGVCDVVEFHPDEAGVALHGKAGKFLPMPVEYKRGKPKEHDADVLQLCGQAMCLEDMLVCDIPRGYLFYGETRRRLEVLFDESLRQRVRDMLLEMHSYLKRGFTPKASPTKSCKACAQQDICLPTLGKSKSAKAYLHARLGEEAAP